MIALGLGGIAAQAGSFSVSPVQVALSSKRPVSTVVVTNDGAEPSVVQLDVMDWAQNATDDVYSATPELLATPPIFTLAPGGKQVVRIGLRRAPDARQELTYRLYLEEIPPPATADNPGMRMALRLGVPVFVAPLSKSTARLHWSAASTPEGSVKITLANDGTAHIKIANLQLTAPGTAEDSRVKQVAAYVLPGHEREWLLQTTQPIAPGSKVRLKAHSDSNAEIIADLSVGTP